MTAVGRAFACAIACCARTLAAIVARLAVWLVAGRVGRAGFIGLITGLMVRLIRLIGLVVGLMVRFVPRLVGFMSARRRRRW